MREFDKNKKKSTHTHNLLLMLVKVGSELKALRESEMTNRF